MAQLSQVLCGWGSISGLGTSTCHGRGRGVGQQMGGGSSLIPEKLQSKLKGWDLCLKNQLLIGGSRRPVSLMRGGTQIS